MNTNIKLEHYFFFSPTFEDNFFRYNLLCQKKKKFQEKNYRHYFKYVTIKKKINEQFSFYLFFLFF